MWKHFCEKMNGGVAPDTKETVIILSENK